MAALALLLLPLLAAGCAGASGAPTASAVNLPVIERPAQLAPYHVFITDLRTGDVSELGERTYHVSESVHGLGLSADGHSLFVSDIAGNRLVVFSLANGLLSGQHAAPVGEQPVHMVGTLDGRTVYVSNFGGQTISVVDTATWTQRASIVVPPYPHSIVLSPDGRWVYAACYGGHAIAVIDAASATLAGTIALPVNTDPYGLAISRDGRYLYTTDNLTGRLFVLDAGTRSVLTTLPVGLRPALIARSPDGTRLYVANGGSATVSVFDLSDPAHPVALGAPIRVDGYPHGIAVTPDGRYVVVANTIGQNLSVIDTRSDTVVANIPAEKYPNDVLITG